MIALNKQIAVLVGLFTFACIAFVYVIMPKGGDLGTMEMLKYAGEMNKQMKIADSMIEFAKAHEGRLPKNLEEMVLGGFMPSRSNVYVSPYSSHPDAVSEYADSVYSVDGLKKNSPFYIFNKLSIDNDKVPVAFTEVEGRIDRELMALQKDRKTDPVSSE